MKLLSTQRFLLSAMLLALPILADGQDQKSSDAYLYWGGTEKVSFVAAPTKMFVYKDSTVSQDYLINLLNRVIDSEYKIIWCPRTYPDHLTDRYHEDACDVIVDDALIDNIISELAKDDGILTARRVYMEKDDFEYIAQHPEFERTDSITNPYSYSQKHEIWFFNEIPCFYAEKKAGEVPLDSISKALNLSILKKDGSSVTFRASKTADIFDLSIKLFETSYFSYAVPYNMSPFSTYGGTTGMKTAGAAVQGKAYYDMSGRKKDSPSGLTIVVEQNSDGTIRTEKKVF